MQILLLEDAPERVEWFKRRSLLHTLDHTDKSGQAIEWLHKRKYDLILLDHDLEIIHYGGYNESQTGTGYDVAKWLEEHPDILPDTHIVIHSVNPSGSRRMEEALRGRPVWRCPFIILQSLVFEDLSALLRHLQKH